MYANEVKSNSLVSGAEADRFAKDMQEKMRAAARQDADYGRIGSPIAPERSGTPIEQALEDAQQAVAELAAQVEEVLARISPVCQQGAALAQGSGAEKASNASPSPVRAEIMKLCYRVNSISARIASVRFTIEI